MGVFTSCEWNTLTWHTIKSMYNGTHAKYSSFKMTTVKGADNTSSETMLSKLSPNLLCKITHDISDMYTLEFYQCTCNVCLLSYKM